jgi:glucokinase
VSRHLGLDLGGTYVKWVVLEDSVVTAKGQTKTRAEAGPEAVTERLIAAGRDAGRVDSVGIGVPGLFDSTTGAVTFLTNVPGAWKGRPLARHVGDALGAPATLINDARAFALAEWTLGAARGCDTAVFAVVGTGVGGGIVVGGSPHEGREGRAGELGHQTIDPDGPLCNCGNRGCVEALVRAALEAKDVRLAGKLLGIGLGNAIVLLAPELIVVGGGVAVTGERLLRPLRKEIRKRVRVSVPVDVVRAELGVLAGAIGAALRGAEGVKVGA